MNAAAELQNSGPAIRRDSGFRVHPAGWIVITSVLIGLPAYFTVAILNAREAAHHTNCRGHMSQIAFAMHAYHDVYGSFPPAYLADVSGHPMHSWRVLLLPYLDCQAVYDQYRFEEPWNSPHNQTLADRIHKNLFHCPSGPHGDRSPVTDYVVIVGPETIFPGSGSTRLSDLSDGPENTIILAEIARSDIHWMEPRDLDVERMSFRLNDLDHPGISSPHSRGPAVVFADGITAYRLTASVSPESLKALTTIAGREPATRASLIRKNAPPNSLAK